MLFHSAKINYLKKHTIALATLSQWNRNNLWKTGTSESEKACISKQQNMFLRINVKKKNQQQLSRS